MHPRGFELENETFAEALAFLHLITTQNTIIQINMITHTCLLLNVSSSPFLLHETNIESVTEQFYIMEHRTLLPKVIEVIIYKHSRLREITIAVSSALLFPRLAYN
jgi:hypothetical protein